MQIVVSVGILLSPSVSTYRKETERLKFRIARVHHYLESQKGAKGTSQDGTGQSIYVQ